MPRRTLPAVACLLVLLGPGLLRAQPFHLDPSFGDGGRLIDPSAGFDLARAVIVQPDGKILVAGGPGPSFSFGIIRYLSNGDPDPAFFPPVLPIQQGFGGMALQSDGRIVVVGYTGTNFGVARLLEGGSPDPTFDGDGHQSTDFGATDFATAVAIQPDGKIVVSGFSGQGGFQAAVAVARYLTDGNLDLTFGTGGKVLGPEVMSTVGTPRVLLDSQGRIVIHGNRELIRLLSNGAPDQSFGVMGLVALGPDYFADSIAAAPDDAILVVGGANFGAAAVLERYTSAGALDVAFGDGGQVRFGSPAFYSFANAAAVLPDGRFYVASDWLGAFFLGRFQEDGSPDTTFAPGGFLLTTIGFAPTANDLVVQSNGSVVLAGQSSSATSAHDATLARYAACGPASLPPPTISSVEPTEAPAGGALVEITGTALDPGLDVRIGGAVASVAAVPAPGIVEVSVVHPMGLADVAVRNPDCQAASLPDAIFFHPSDVAPADLYYPFVKRMVLNEVTGGCTFYSYCPDDGVTRAEMAVFLLRSKEGPTYEPPPATGTVFTDVPIDGFAAAWIEELSRRGITAGCDVNLFCPYESNTRAQMAVFLLVTLEGTGYQPPDPTGIFSDVSVSSPYACWVEEIHARGITAGCGMNTYCPDDPVLREQMAVFLSVTFNLPG